MDTLQPIAQDFASMRDALIQRIRSRYPGDWSDFAASNFGMALVDLIAWIHTTQCYTINRVSSELFLPTLTLRESAVRLGQLVGYQLRGPTAASVYCEAYIDAAIGDDITIQQGTLIRSSTGTPFEVAEDYTILSGQVSPQKTVARFSVTETGPTVIASKVIATGGSTIIDLVDTTINLKDYLSPGQSFQFIGSTDETVYTIEQITFSDASLSNSRLILTDSVVGSFEATEFEATVFDSRIKLIQGQTMTEKFVAPSTTQENFAIQLNFSPVISNTADVTVNGVDWTLVASLYSSLPDDTVYIFRSQANDKNIVQFGNDRFGKTIPPDAVIEVTYRIGGGQAGNVRVGSIDTTITGYVASSQNPVSITVVNRTTSGQGGQDKETVDQARESIPAYIRSNDRAVTLSDWQNLAAGYSHPTYGSVSYARAATRGSGSFVDNNIIVVYAWTTGPDGGLVSLSPPLKQALADYLMTKAIATDLVIISDGSERPVPISLQFKVLPGYDLATTKRSVESTIATVIARTTPGSPIVHSDLLRSLDEVAGVDHVDMATPISNLVTTNPNELFTVPQDDFVYTIDRIHSSVITNSADDASSLSVYTAQLPVYPVAPWSIKLYLGGVQLSVLLDSSPGFARLYRVGLLSVSDQYKSTINLLTGQVVLYLKGSPGDLTMKLVSVQAYGSERFVDIHVGYTGLNSQAKRREIRSAIQTWMTLGVGQTLYASEQTGIVESKSNLSSVIGSIADVTAVTRVALGAPGSTDVKITPSESEVIRAGKITINSSLD